MLSISRKIYSKLLTKIFSPVNIPFCIFIFTFAIYIRNLSPSVYGGDSGDFLTAVITRGIPHPSGYPLYTILGIIFTSLPGSFSIAWKYGLVSALFSAISVVLMYFIVNGLVKKRAVAIATSLILAFTYPFWLYAEIVEVFALQSAIVLSLILTTLKYTASKKSKYLYWLAFLAGLSLTNNLSVVILFPSIILTVFISNRRVLLDYKMLARSICFFLLGLTPYLYIPLAAKSFPEMNWGVPVNLKNFFDLVTRKYYSWGFTDTHERFNSTIINYRFGVFFDYWKTYVHNLIPLFVASGFIQLLRKKKYLVLFFFASSFFLFGPLFTVYSGTYFKSFLSLATLEKFYITTLIISFLFIPFGVNFYFELFEKIKLRKIFLVIFKKSVYLIIFLIPAALFITNFQRTNFRNVFIGDNLGKDILLNIPEESILLLRNDSLSFNTIYYQKAYNFNESVSIPGPHNGFEILIKTFVDKDKLREYKIVNQGTLDKDNLNASIAPLMNQSDVYIDGFYSLTDSKYGKIVTVPYGLLYKFEFYENLPYPKEKYIKEIKQITDSYQLDELMNHEEILSYSLILADIKKLYSVAFYNIADFLHEQYQEDQLAKAYLTKSIKLDPVITSDEVVK